jgi:hypothetical protein
MNGELAQLIALVGHGNAFLTQGGDPPDLLDSNSTFRFVRSVEFVGCDRKRPRTFRDTSSWFVYLQENGVRALELAIRRITDPTLVAFANSGAWSLVASSARSTAWSAAWSVVDRRVTKTLFVAVLRALVAGANSFGGSTAQDAA